ncbi:MAG: NAD(P)/FAD-dependent oxidoreductase [Sphaerochaeta sp.]|jgi:uncharacterized FAD-dependent dehydrogenase|nr:NAD(P)/FAD-dependent oxidoreductase [Sphaerochaeta sp.]MCI2077150.1 NAD(P)/FAD-dependent oxidoreductase [Sphaerochaeta sp.]MCI2097287.1 NAD(P)/FAD-dependent oxidoreductase [Sphaerochaeta sp.]MCI2105037.1 NAD(P)/FAD-dependent oxidoreductase [Sphaerochaeta sp.]
MNTTVRLRLSPRDAGDDERLRKLVAKAAGVNEQDISGMRIIRSSIDARRRDVIIDREIQVFSGEEPSPAWEKTVYQSVGNKKPVIIVGSGPAGLFCALRLLEIGIRPIVLERGNDVEQRKLDIARMVRSGRTNPESNYGFGEGGAGAFSDGKLFTRSDKRGDVSKVLSQFCQMGADESILWEARPHIGSDKLPQVVAEMRKTIIACGGDVQFGQKVTSFLIHAGKVVGVKTEKGDTYDGPVVLATGHSAREMYQYLFDNGFEVEAKALAVGVRLEHPQELIDRIQYHTKGKRGPYLPPADYTFVSQQVGRGVYSFCMCPGGVIVPAGTEDGHLVVNGMSASTRSSRWANSGMVVELHPEDLPQDRFGGELGMLHLLEALESRCWQAGGGRLVAPAQRMTDFLSGTLSKSLPQTSYAPGLASVDLSTVFPAFISKRLQMALAQFGAKAKGFLSSEAVLIAPETRTSSPVRIPRDPQSLMHVSHDGLFPCGEGAGYAGGIVSSALDGMAVADAVGRYLGR